MSNLRKKTDNSHFAAKVALRMEAIKNLESVNVLDCFAGNNLIWKKIPHDSYLGIEKQKGKGELNIYGDNVKIIKSLDLSNYNVIDLDAYGIPGEQMIEIMENKTLADEVVIIYTATAMAFSNCSKKFIEKIGIEYDTWNKCRTLWNKHILYLWYFLLSEKCGIKNINLIDIKDRNYRKHYGYFVLRKNAINGII